ncbi:Syntaxin-43, partial [Mucuna pruriens]
MATRNRTVEFRKHRDAVKSVRAPLSSSASASTGPVIEMVTTSFLRSNRSSYAPLSTDDPGPATSRDAFTVGLPPSWVDDSEEITTNIQRARIKISELTKAHAKALMPSFDDGREDQRLIETLTQEITSLLRKSEVRLKRLSAAAGSSEDSNVRKNVQRSLATDLQNLSMDLRRKQSAYLKRLQQQKEGYDGVDLEMNFNGSKFESHNDEFSDVGFSEEQMTKLKKSEQFSVEREREIEQAILKHLVVKSVHELAQIMKDLSVLVIDQGTIVDRIDYNIQSVATSVEEGFKQLQKVLFLLMFLLTCTETLLSLYDCNLENFSFGFLAAVSLENTEKRRNGYVCNSACYNVLYHASSLDTQGDSLLVILLASDHFTGQHHVNSSVRCESNCIVFKDKYHWHYDSALQ